MGNKVHVSKKTITAVAFCFFVAATLNAQTTGNKKDSILFLPANDKTFPVDKSQQDVHPSSFFAPFVHSLGFENRPEYIFPTNTFLNGVNNKREPLRFSFSPHLTYSFRFHPNSLTDRIYSGAYQGIGLARYSFGDPEELGNPFAFYLFQGARLNRFAPFLSLGYEWNFGLSFGWKPFDAQNNPNNHVIGSKVNAYLNTNLYLNWVLSRRVELTTGVTLTHFSNGNTKFPNKGLNTTGGKIGLVYNLDTNNRLQANEVRPAVPVFPRHVSYELVLFGAGCRTGVDFMDGQVASPEMYPVLGFYFASMYNLSYRFRVGASVDGTYDGSANIYMQEYFTDSELEFFTPPLREQLALGFSARAEYIMPYFTIGIGMGKNVIYEGKDMNIYYQSLALKIEVTRNSFLHIGYSLCDFHNPNFLMLGVGYRFNNKYPVFYR